MCIRDRWSHLAWDRPNWSLVAEPSVYTTRSCGLLFSLRMRSLVSGSVFTCSPFWQCFPNFFGRSVSWRRRNRFGYLSHSLACLSSVSIESSAWPIQDLPHSISSLHPSISQSRHTAAKCSEVCRVHSLHVAIVPHLGPYNSSAARQSLDCFVLVDEGEGRPVYWMVSNSVWARMSVHVLHQQMMIVTVYSLYQAFHCWFPCLFFCLRLFYMEWPSPSSPTETLSGPLQM